MHRKLPFFLLVSWSLSSTCLGKEQEVVHHPAPKKPQYVGEDLYAGFKKQLPLPPSKGSEKQKQDEEELFQLQKTRTPEDCERAKSEIFVSLENFFGLPHGPVKKSDAQILTPFFEQIRNDGDYFIQKLKKDFPRQRPFLYLKEISPCVSKEVTGAYPSGHAVLSKLFALILGDFYPDQKEKLDARAKQIADDRILVGMHHRSDIEAGQSLAAIIYGEFKKSSKYSSEFKKLQDQLASTK
jgi:acid phosphatase (class A)